VQVKPRAPLSFAAAEELLVTSRCGSSFGATIPSSSSTMMPRCPLAQPSAPPTAPPAEQRHTPAPSHHRRRESSSGEPLLPDVPQTSPPPHRVALATVPDPPRRRPVPGSGRPSLTLVRAPMIPLPPHGPRQRQFTVGRTPSPCQWAAPVIIQAGYCGPHDAVPAGHVGTVQAGRSLKLAR
jgi:hypothetical protein